MKIILRYANTYKKALVIALFLMVVELVIELVQPIIMARIIDEGILQEDLQTVYFYGAILVGISVLAFVGGIISSFYASEVSQGVGYDMRRDMFERVQMFSVMKIKQFATSTLLTRLTNDVTQVQGLLFASMRIMLRAPLFIIFGIVMSFTLNVSLGLILIAIVPIILIIMIFLMTKGMKLFRKVQEKMDTVNRVIQENLVAIKLIKAFQRRKYENRRFSDVNQSLKDVNKKALWVMEIVMPIVMLVMNVALIALIWFGNLQLEGGNAQAGEVVAVINYATRILASFGVFSFLLMNLSRGRTSAKRIEEILVEDTDDLTSEEEKLSLHGDVTFEDVSFRYPDATKNSLTSINLQANAGQKIGIIGETGSGKTTLLHLIPYLFKATSGKVMIDGKDINQLKNRVRYDITLVPQEGFLFSGTILDNIRWGNEELAEEHAIQAAKEAQLHDFIMSLPNGYHTFVGQRGVNLSGGQKQRLSIARALADNPKILLLDDSTSALDADTEKRVLQAIRERHCTTFLVSQKISSVLDADIILLLQDGKTVAKGTHEQLLQNSSLYQRIWDSQRREQVGMDG
ncbi:ATP-binding cassette subfamily B protein [Gracilibacillus halotolerans]|uniref:ATP-binding cassette subfamily B protein n=1 Tax=Gracilibacillus halotolerans TaxID=74386 RepID=A0A841RJ64_9BACI|nr:ABC transporter ATP-binding protein [Gracilibacillus halotolerans]MBB6512539.1 ATP-binding cassette subfamily B protein [Gracilibacillus halotolerans]